MIEKNFQRKITSYLDGSLSPAEKSEFEAFVATHPGFKDEIRQKEEEIERIKSLIPAIQLSPRASEALHYEIKQSVFTLLKREPKNFWENLKDRFEEWSNR